MVCGTATGEFSVRRWQVRIGDDEFVTPRQFEILGGKGKCKSWKQSVRVRQQDGTPGVRMRTWLEQRGVGGPIEEGSVPAMWRKTARALRGCEVQSCKKESGQDVKRRKRRALQGCGLQSCKNESKKVRDCFGGTGSLARMGAVQFRTVFLNHDFERHSCLYDHRDLGKGVFLNMTYKSRCYRLVA